MTETTLTQGVGQLDKTARAKAFVTQQAGFERAIKAARKRRLKLKIPQHQISRIAHLQQSKISSLEKLRLPFFTPALVKKYLLAVKVALKFKDRSGNDQN